MAIATVFTRGYGNGTFDGTIPLVLLRGYGGVAVVSQAQVSRPRALRISTATGAISRSSMASGGALSRTSQAGSHLVKNSIDTGGMVRPSSTGGNLKRPSGDS